MKKLIRFLRQLIWREEIERYPFQNIRVPVVPSSSLEDLDLDDFPGGDWIFSGYDKFNNKVYIRHFANPLNQHEFLGREHG